MFSSDEARTKHLPPYCEDIKFDPLRIMSISISAPARPVNKKPWLTTRTRRALWGYFFIAPALIYFFVWVALPVIISFGLSFTNYDTAHAKWIGMQNYLDILTKSEVQQALLRTVQFAAELVPLNIVIALFLAVLIDQKLRGVGFFRTLYYLPVLTSLVVAGIVWTSLYDPRTGAVNWIMKLVGLPPQLWLHNPDLALHSVVVVRLWKGVGYNMMVFLAGLQTIPTSLYEAATIGMAPTPGSVFVTSRCRCCARPLSTFL